MVDQVGIAITGVAAVFLTQCQRESLRRYACLFGLAGQPFWFYASIESGQWGVRLVSVLYTIAWAKGVWTFWIRGGSAA